MQRILLRAAVVGVVVAGAGIAQAQLPGALRDPYLDRPTVNPYINLLRDDTPPGLLYLGEIRPQFQLRQGLAAQQQALARLQGGYQALAGRTSALEGTGHPTYFQNYSHYYSFSGASRPAVGGFGR